MIKAHRHFAAEAFNQCWELMDLPSRSPQQTREMIRLAEASFWHWQNSPDCAPQNTAISHWQLSRVYALAGDATTALHYAMQGLAVAKEDALEPFYLGYAWESAARAYFLAGMTSKGEVALQKAQAAAARVKDLANKAALELDLINLRPVDETTHALR